MKAKERESKERVASGLPDATTFCNGRMADGVGFANDEPVKREETRKPKGKRWCDGIGRYASILEDRIGNGVTRGSDGEMLVRNI